LKQVIEGVLPGIEHRNCARHVHANWSKEHKGKVLKGHFWHCVKATNEAMLEERLEYMGKTSLRAMHGFKARDMKRFVKAFFNEGVKCDIVDNNLCEAFNATLVRARSKPIIHMLEDIRVGVMKRIAKKRLFVDKWPGNHGNLVLKKLSESVAESVNWRVDFNGAGGYEVKRGMKGYVVKLRGVNTCSCRGWELSGIPCAHAICAILHSKELPVDYIADCYSKEMYCKTYEHTLEPVNGENMWPKTTFESIHAPIPRNMTGRPKKNRKREENEPRAGTSISRRGRIMTCSLCKKEGHNKRYCPTKPASETGAATGSSTQDTE
jgi:hypothetical protein